MFLVGMWGAHRLSPVILSTSVLTTGWMIVVSAGLLLAWRFHRDSVFFSILVIAAAWLIVGAVAGPGFSNIQQSSAAFLNCLVIMDIVLFFHFRDRGLLSIHGVVRALFIAIQVIGFMLLLKQGGPAWIGRLAAHLWHGIETVGTVSLIFISIGLCILFLQFMKTRSPLSAGGFWSLAAVFFMFSEADSRYTGTVWAILAVGVLVIAIVEQSFQLAYRDELTGLPGRRALNEFLVTNTGNITVLMVDIDHFKRFNDRYGHDVGDQVLKLVASRLAGVRGGKAYRYGGEEFIIVFPGKALNDVLPRAEETRKSVKKAEFVLRSPWKRRKGGPKKRKNSTSSGKRLSVTVSIGIAETNRQNNAPSEVIKAADKALYRAKRTGRNRVSR